MEISAAVAGNGWKWLESKNSDHSSAEKDTRDRVHLGSAELPSIWIQIRRDCPVLSDNTGTTQSNFGYNAHKRTNWRTFL